MAMIMLDNAGRVGGGFSIVKGDWSKVTRHWPLVGFSSFAVQENTMICMASEPCDDGEG